MDILSGILISSFTIIAGIWYLSARAGRTSRGFWVFLFLSVQRGRQTVIELMTSADLFFSGLRMIAWGLIFLSVLAINVAVMAEFASPVEPHNFFVAVNILSVLFAAMSFVKALYFFVRGVFCRRGQV